MHLLVNRYNRVLYDDDSVFGDYGQQITNWDSETMPGSLVLDEDFIYIGAPHSFASRFFLVDTPNSVTAKLTVQFYDNNTSDWADVKNLRDETSVAGAPFGQSGFITWDIPDTWISRQVNGVPELPEGQTNPIGHPDTLYWIRIKSSASLDAGTLLRWIGVIWTSQALLKGRWDSVLSDKYLPDGETDWYKLIEISTGDVAEDLNIQNVIDYELQAKDINELSNLATLKTLVNILLPFRSVRHLQEMRDEWEKMYQKGLRKRLRSIDKNKDEKLDQQEKTVPLTSSRLIRT